MQKEEDFPGTRHFIAEMLKAGNMESLAQHIERGRGIICLQSMTPEDRARFALALRTGSSLSRSEKRPNREACRNRDLFLSMKVLFWTGAGLPGFSNTSQNTAFHSAVNDFESKIPLEPDFETFDSDFFKGAPLRTAESLYRHVWKPYLGRIRRDETTEDDKLLLNDNSLRPFMRGIRRSEPEPSELKRRLQWFESNFRRPGVRFSAFEVEILRLREMLNAANLPADNWRQSLRLCELQTSKESQRRVDEILTVDE